MKRCGTPMQCSSSCAPEWQLKRCKLVDRFSDLPDDILVSILSRLKLKQAGMTSVLSRRWVSLWTLTTGTLDFHYSDYCPDDAQGFQLSLAAFFEPYLRSTGKLPLVEREKLTDWVNHILSLHQGSTINTFEVSTMLFGRIKKSVIDKWVEFALKKRVKILKLDFEGAVPSRRGNYSLKKALLGKFSFELVSLTVINLNKVDVTDKVIHYILSKCLFLEELHVRQSSSLFELKVCGPLPRLKCLKIIGCRGLKYIEINAINVSSFAYVGYNIPVTFMKAPPLVEASFGGSYSSYFVKIIGQFSSYLSRVESLKLELRCGNYLRDEVHPKLPIFKHLTELVLILKGFSVNRTLFCCACFLKKCPMLKRFSLKASPKRVDGHREEWRIERSSLCLHSHLRLVELTGFNGFEGAAKVYCYIVCSLPSLKRVNLYPGSRKYFGNSEIKEKLADLAKHMEQIMPPGVELIIQA